MTCQALIPVGDAKHRVCRQDRYASWEVSCATVKVVVDLCEAHGELVMRERGFTLQAPPFWLAEGQDSDGQGS